jgi:DNA-binding transcriptional regulator YhcF (GntR family)
MFAFRSRPTSDDAEAPFSSALRAVLMAAREEAVDLAHDFVGPEHLLLAMARDPEDETSRLLTAAGAGPAAVRARLRMALVRGTDPARTQGEFPFTSRARKSMDLAIKEAGPRRQVRPVHLLVAVAAEGEGIAAQVLRDVGVTPATLRAALAGGEIAAAGAVPGDAAGEDVAGGAFRLEIDEASDRSIFEQIVAGVQEAVATGRLHGGERLPSVRRMADQLDVAPGTVARAYGELERLGVVVTDGARGTRVAQRPPAAPDPARAEALQGMMRRTAIAAFHMGATEAELREALDRATRDLLTHGDGPGADAS